MNRSLVWSISGHRERETYLAGAQPLRIPLQVLKFGNPAKYSVLMSVRTNQWPHQRKSCRRTLIHLQSCWIATRNIDRSRKAVYSRLYERINKVTRNKSPANHSLPFNVQWNSKANVKKTLLWTAQNMEQVSGPITVRIQRSCSGIHRFFSVWTTVWSNSQRSLTVTQGTIKSNKTYKYFFNFKNYVILELYTHLIATYQLASVDRKI